MATARPFAYNTGSAIDGTVQVGDLAVGFPTSGFSSTGLVWWNGPDEELGYVIAKSVPNNSQPTPVPDDALILSTTYKGVDIVLSNNNQTAAQIFGYQQSVLGEIIISGTNKVMFSVLCNLLEPQTLIGSHVIGVGTTSMNYSSQYGAYPGNDIYSIGFSDDGNYYYNGGVVASGLPTWTDGDIIDIVISHGQYWWIRVNGGYWNNNSSANPTTLSNGLTMNGVTNFYPVLCPSYQGIMTVLNYPKYGVPSDYNFLGNVSASVGFFRTSGFNDNEFINYANLLLNENYITASEASSGLTSNGYWNSYTNPIIVPTSGLTLYVDAGQSLSYSGSGNQWYDLSGNNNTGTLQNSPTYSSSNGGVLTFNGSNQYISFSSPINIPIGNSNYTISVWFNAASLGANGFVGWGNYGSGNQVNAFRLGGSNILNYWWGNDLAAAASITTNTWYNAVARFDGTNRQIWVNNVMVSQDTPGSGHNVPNANNLRIGSTNNGEYFNGKISNVEIYDRAISDSEIAQIYNNLSSRFLP
jgi:hypothetical protein